MMYGSLVAGAQLVIIHFMMGGGGIPDSVMLCGEISVAPQMTGNVAITTLLHGTTIVTPLLTGESELSCECGC